MELEKFEQAQKIKEKLDKMGRQRSKLEASLKSCSLGVKIEFTHTGAFRRKDEVSLYNKDLIKEMIFRELKKLDEEIELVKEEFLNL
jgi:hypothetical protein